MILTTGYEIQGYFITDYLDVIFDEMLVGMGFGKAVVASLDNLFSAVTGSEATEMIDKLNRVKIQLRERVIERAEALGANALIGIDFESSRLGDLVMVSMTATAVKIDEIISPRPRLRSEQLREIEAAKKEEAEREKQQRIDYIREHSGEFQKELFMETLLQLQSTQEMADYIQKIAEDRSDLFSEELLRKLPNCLYMERMYGKGTGKESLINAVKEHFGM